MHQRILRVVGREPAGSREQRDRLRGSTRAHIQQPEAVAGVAGFWIRRDRIVQQRFGKVVPVAGTMQIRQV